MTRLRTLGAALVIWALASLPRAAAACTVCVSTDEEASTAAFRYTTVLLSLLPLGMVGGAVLWVRRRLRQLEARREAAPLARAPVPR